MALFGRNRDAEAFCALCARPRVDVVALVAGDRGAVCTHCLPDAIALADGPHTYAILHNTLDRELQRFHELAPLQQSRPLVEAALAFARDDAARLRVVAFHAFRLTQWSLGLDALARIPQRDRMPRDRLSQAHACHGLGRYRQGLELLEALDASTLTDEDRALFYLNRATLTLRAHPLLDGPELEAERKRVSDAGRLLQALPPSDAVARYRASVSWALALCELRAQRPAHAESLLREVFEGRDREAAAEHHLLLGDALAAQGRSRQASAAWHQGLKQAHPDSLEAAELKKRITGVYR